MLAQRLLYLAQEEAELLFTRFALQGFQASMDQ